jgi:signal transduction histidine kinase
MDDDKIILLIGDNPEDAMSLIDLINSELNGLNIVWVDNIEEGKKFLEKEDVELVLLNSVCTDHLKNIYWAYEHIPIILLSDSYKEDLAIKAVQEGAQDYLIKESLSPDVLKKAIIYAIERNKIIRERLLYANKLKKYSEELEDKNENKDKLFSIVAHDLRSPFQVLNSIANILLGEMESFNKDEIIKIASELKKTLTIQHEVVDNLLTWVQIQKERIEFNPRRIFLSDKVDKVKDQLKIHAQNKNIQIVNSVPPGIIVWGDMDMLQTIFHNIIYNGIKYCNYGGTIEINARKDETEVVTSISDDGIGMNQDVLDKIFTIHKSKKREGTMEEKGTGLGLNICKEMIEKHGGRIWAESTKDKGSTFYFSLPFSFVRI